MMIHNYRTPSYQRQNLVNMRFIHAKISRSKREIMLCEALSEFLQRVLPLPCNACINVTSLWLWSSTHYVTDMAVKEWRIRMRACGKVKGGHFKHRVIDYPVAYFSLDHCLDSCLAWWIIFNLYRRSCWFSLQRSFVSVIKLIWSSWFLCDTS